MEEGTIANLRKILTIKDFSLERAGMF